MSSGNNIDPLQEFERLPSGLWRILVTGGVLVGLLLVTVIVFHWPFDKLGIHWPLQGESLRRFVFVSYMCMFAAVWITYFLSRSRIRFFHVRTLRRLLAKTSEQWQEHLDAQDRKGFAEFEDSQHEKAQSSMVTVAIMIAVCVIVLGEIHCVFLESPRVDHDMWGDVILAGSTVAATLSLICFIISVDALDSIFNKFRTHKVRVLLKRHFYMKTINPKYCGFIALIVSIILIVAYHSLTLSSAVLTLSIIVGYPHWFPNIQYPSHSRRESLIFGVIWFIVILVLKVCV